MRRWKNWKKFRSQPRYLQITEVVCMCFIVAVGVSFSIAFWMKGAGWVSVLPTLGFLIMAFEEPQENK